MSAVLIYFASVWRIANCVRFLVSMLKSLLVRKVSITKEDS